jgi:hypothetical protein
MLVAQERRTGPRAPLTGTAVVHCREAKVPCEILDVGAMGIGLLAPTELVPGEFVRVVFRMGAANGPERVQQADGVVVGVSRQGAGCRVGIQFTVIEGHVASQIHEYVVEQGIVPRRRTGEYAPMDSYPRETATPPTHRTGEYLAAIEHEEEEDVDVAATGTDDEDVPRSLSGMPTRGPAQEADAPIDRELLRLYLDAIRTVDATRKNRS